MKFLWFVFSLFLPAWCFAGYYAQVTDYVPNLQYTKFAAGQVSGCYLTPSMAISALAGTTSYYLVDRLDSDGNWSVIGTTSTGGSVSGVFGQCEAAPIVNSIPPFAGGVTDPAIFGGSVLSGSGGSSGGGYSDSTIAALQTEIASLQSSNTTMAAELVRIGAIQNAPFDLGVALSGTAFAFSSVLFLFAISRSVGEVLRVLRRRA